jgi:hypothetical protein
MCRWACVRRITQRRERFGQFVFVIRVIWQFGCPWLVTAIFPGNPR